VTDINAGRRDLREHHERSLADVVNEIKVELKEFLVTRFEILRAEMNENFTALKAGIPMLLIGSVLGWPSSASHT
jgi:phosphate/sulfate permease